MTRYKTVCITGASSGIGYELAKIFSTEGYELILTARNVQKLNRLKGELEQGGSQKIWIIPGDLSEKGTPVKLFEEIKKRGIEVDILINNAGMGYVGLFHEKTLEEDSKTIQLNIVALTQLTKLFAKEMIKKKKGKILNVASTGSYHPGPYTAVYYATKAYVLSFTEALAIELKPYGISVLALCLGATKTEFSKRAGRKDTKAAMSAKEVAQKAFDGLMRDKGVIIPGFRNRLFITLPRRWAAPLVGRYQKTLLIKK